MIGFAQDAGSRPDRRPPEQGFWRRLAAPRNQDRSWWGGGDFQAAPIRCISGWFSGGWKLWRWGSVHGCRV